jgi:hypothetical protein
VLFWKKPTLIVLASGGMVAPLKEILVLQDVSSAINKMTYKHK